ncbi:acetate/propionate family kinase [Pelagicoccus sp. SDUM812002]|uniref:acetate/propionate family kinase n=1 Tax=Pelagicoccus sp. SDUM812002 TaxID=3041266 RepID=UPI00280F1558|nr:acetate/propionate family kinase [Pelagicoccus sp. SDUM812002]MDQ8188431.1 acetate/propionate family kinase [Pelagicoccus sp. SDUM812002]
MSPKSVLTINCGSETLRFAAIDTRTGKRWLDGEADKLGSPKSIFEWQIDGGPRHNEKLPRHIGICRCLMLIELVLKESRQCKSLQAIVYRVVHGGSHYRDPVIVDDKVLEDLEELVPLAPQHNPVALRVIRFGRSLFPNLQHIACFDTGFHKTLPPRAYTYGVPYDWYTEHGIRRYGFHGFSHRHAAEETARILGKSVSEIALISVHLGNGCSVNATQRGRSIDNSMGFTPMEGVVMGSRSGDVDPGLVSYLAKQMNMGIEEIHDSLSKRSGLLGLSGVSNDVRELRLPEHTGKPRVELAIDVFTYRLAKEIAGARAALDSLDAIAFTGGIGANDFDVRKRIVARLEFLGTKLDKQKNEDNGTETGGIINHADSSVPLLAVPVNEEAVMAKTCSHLIRKHVGKSRVWQPPEPAKTETGV